MNFIAILDPFLCIGGSPPPPSHGSLCLPLNAFSWLESGNTVDSVRNLDLSGADMEIILDRRALKQIRLSATDAIEENDTETLREDIHDAFSEEQVEEIERRIDGGDFYELLSELIDEWSGDDVDELLELIEAQLSEAGMELKYATDEYEEEEEEEDDEPPADEEDDVIEDDADLDLDDDDDDNDKESEEDTEDDL